MPETEVCNIIRVMHVTLNLLLSMGHYCNQVIDWDIYVISIVFHKICLCINLVQNMFQPTDPEQF